MTNNIMTFTNRKVCELLTDGTYPAEIVKSKLWTKNDACMIVDFIVYGKEQGNLTMSGWFYDSSDKDALIRRKQLFTAIGHPEWFDIEKFDVTQLIGYKLQLTLGSYFKNNTNQLVNNIKEYLPMPKGQQTVDASMTNDDIEF